MILLCGGEKGGTGKSTIATNLAAMRLKETTDVLLLDTDPQASSSYWSSIRDEDESLKRVSCVQKFGKGLEKELYALSEKYDDLIIDAGGRDSAELRASMLAADMILIPVMPGQFDVWTLDRVERLISEAGNINAEFDALVVINRAAPNPQIKEVEELKELLEEFENLTLAETVIRDRIAYRRAVREGKSVIEMTPKDGKAGAEMMNLYEEVYGKTE
jgi:chromosome partitioning protein